jgi:hypothetical protein
MPFYPQSVTSHEMYPNYISFRCFHLELAFEFIKEPRGASGPLYYFVLRFLVFTLAMFGVWISFEVWISFGVWISLECGLVLERGLFLKVLNRPFHLWNIKSIFFVSFFA